MGVITISQQHGSGGEEVAEKVAAKIGYSIVAREEIQEKLIELADEGTAEIVIAEKSPGIIDRLAGDTDVRVTKSLLTESLLSFAKEGSVILLGRGGFDILQDVPGVLHVFFGETLEKRAAHVSLKEEMSLNDSRENVKKTDKIRAGFFKNYFGKDWPDPALFHLSIKPLSIGIDTCADAVVSVAGKMDIFSSFDKEGRSFIQRKLLLTAVTNRIVLNSDLDIELFEVDLLDDERIGIKFSHALGVKFARVPMDVREKAIKVAGDFAQDYAVIEVK
jgi:cytidylate kinase